MIIEHIVEGSKETSFHDFQITLDGMNIIISPGHYYRNGNLVFANETETVITIPSEPMNYDIYLTTNGFEMFSFTDEQGSVEVPNLIDKLVWMAVREETEFEVHFMVIKEPHTV